MYLNSKESIKKIFCIIITTFIVTCLFITTTFAWGRKLVTKNASSTLYWSAYTIKFSFNASAGLTYDDNNNITSISDLSLSGHTYTVSPTFSGGVSCMLSTKQKSKRFSGRTATYVVTLTRNVMGFYVDNVDLTLTYKTTDSGTPFSIDRAEPMILVDIEEGKPYNIQILE